MYIDKAKVLQRYREKVGGARWDAMRAGAGEIGQTMRAGAGEIGQAMRPSSMRGNLAQSKQKVIWADQLDEANRGLQLAGAGYGAGAAGLGAAGLGAHQALAQPEPEPTGMEAVVAKLRGLLG